MKTAVNQAVTRTRTRARQGEVVPGERSHRRQYMVFHVEHAIDFHVSGNQRMAREWIGQGNLRISDL